MAITYSDKLAYNARYNKDTYKSITVRFNKKTDADMIEYLKNKDITAFIKSLIYSDMKKYHGSEYDPLRGIKLMMREAKEEAYKDIKEYPYEVMEQMPGYDMYTVSFCKSLEDCRAVITDYCLKNSGVGAMYICKRYIDSNGHVYGRKIRSKDL